MAETVRLERDISALNQVFSSLASFIDQEHIDESAAFAIQFVAEELFTNLVRHNTGGSEEIELSIESENGKAVIVLRDFDVDPFDPTSVPEVDPSTPIEDREPGGLGVHLVKSMVEKLSYQYEDRTMTVTAIKRLDV